MTGARLRAAAIRVLVVLLCFILLAPILIVAILSFSGDPYLQFPPRSLSLGWYERFLGNERWRAAILNSALIATMTCVLSSVLGFLTAYAMVRGRMSFKASLSSLLLMPLIIPHVVTAIALYFLSAKVGLIGFRPWIALAHSVVAFPIVLIILRSALQAMDPNLERAAMVFGCTRLQAFRRVVVPLAFPAMISGALFSFLTSFDEVVISLFLAGIRSETLPVRIWNSLMLEIEPTIAAVSTLLVALTTLALVLDWFVRSLAERRNASPS
jgi:ABC-type spermidine/putrescine transport system permease subunit II